MNADYICLIEGRLKFYGAENSAPFPNALVVYDGTTDGNGVPETLLQVLEHRGGVYTREEVEDVGEQARFDELFDTETTDRPAPEVSRGESPLACVSVGDDLRLPLDYSTIGFPTGVDATSTVRVVGRDRDGEVREVLAVADHGPVGSSALKTYFTLSYREELPHEVRVSVCAEGNSSWQDVALREVETVNHVPGCLAPERAVA